MKKFEVVGKGKLGIEGWEYSVEVRVDGKVEWKKEEIDNVGDVFYYLSEDVRDFLDMNCDYMKDKVSYDIKLNVC